MQTLGRKKTWEVEFKNSITQRKPGNYLKTQDTCGWRSKIPGTWKKPNNHSITTWPNQRGYLQGEKVSFKDLKDSPNTENKEAHNL